ncbi:MAG: type II toxin-antitoxin system VapB family antitoxin [Pirellulaceae bacterium]|nr:type II toxin-antitoxin system VapB family antitoxin [Pirellulaceae bacterium]
MRLPFAACVLACETSPTATNVEIDDELLREAQRIGGHATPEETVEEALSEYIQILRVLGQNELNSEYEFKRQPWRK